MTFRDKIKKVFRRNSDKEKEKNNNKPKIEYYRRGECPRSKYRGPVDPEHRKRLYDWNFAAATVDRPRSFDLDLSPCTSLPDRPLDESDVTLDDDTVLSETEPEVACNSHLHIIGSGSITVAHHEVALSASFDTSSDLSTAVVSSCHSSSLTLKESWDWPLAKRDALNSWKESITLAPVTRRTSAPEKRLPFDPHDLSRALNAVQIVS